MMVKKMKAWSALAVLVAVAGMFAWSAVHNGFVSVEATTDKAPTAQTLAATNVTATTATLNGTYNNNGGFGGHVWFEYGLTANGSGWAASNKVGVHGISGSGLVNESVNVRDLFYNTNYYYRIIAENGDGRQAGSIMSFKTQPFGNPDCQPNPKRDLKYEIQYRPTGWTHATAQLTNKSTICSYEVGLASYKTFTPNGIFDQQLFDSETKVIGPGQTVDLRVDLPACQAQIDLFEGQVQTPPTYNYDRLFAGPWVNANLGFCGNVVTPQPATLKIVKTVNNNGGGTKTVSDFALFQNGVQVTHNTAKSYSFANANDSVLVTATETNLAGYTASAWGGDCSSDGKVTLRPGDNKTCTITNTYAPASLGVACAATATSLQTGQSVTYTATATGGTGTYTYSWTGTDSLSGTNNSVSKTYSTAGSKEAIVTVVSGNQTRTATCTVTVTVPTAQTGCLVINKEAYDMHGNRINTVPPFGFKVDNGSQTYTVDAQGNVTVSGLSIGNHTVTEVASSTWDNFSITPANGTVNVGTGSGCAQVIFKNKQVPPTLDGYCVAAPATVNTGENVTFTAHPTGGTGSYTYAWSGPDGISGSATSTTKSFSTAGTRTAQVIISSGNASVTRTCSVVVNTPPVNFNVACAANVSSLNTGGSVTYTATATGGTGTYTYSWTGTDGLTGSSNTNTKSYSSTGTKIADVTVTSGTQSQTARCTVVVNQPTADLAGSCVANPTQAAKNFNITYTASASGGNGSYTYTWSGDDSLSGNGSSVTKSYNSAGRKYAHVQIQSGNQTITKTCFTDILDDTGGGCIGSCGGGPVLQGVCSANPTSGSVGTNITWNASVSGSYANDYTYTWSGTDNLSGTGNTITRAYQTPGTKQANVFIYSRTLGLTTTATCNVNIGGGSVYVAQEPGQGQVAGVFLSEVPYTGIGSNLKIAFFILALFAWSSWISYIIIRRKARKSGVSVAQMFTGTPSLAFAGGMMAPVAPTKRGYEEVKEKIKNSIPIVQNIPRDGITVTPHEPSHARVVEPVKSPFVAPNIEETPVKPEAPKETDLPIPNLPTDNTYEKHFGTSKFQSAIPAKKAVTENRMPTVAKPVAQIALPSQKEDVLESLEMKARELQTVVSADGLAIIAEASGNNKHNALVILNHMVELYKGTEHDVDGDWMVLNGEKISQILFSTYITMTPVFTQWLVEGDDRKAMAFIRMLQMQGQAVKDFITNVVLELDKAYRFRIDNEGEADTQILDLTVGWTDRELEYAIHTLVTAVDQTYTSIYASVKIALIKVLDMAKANKAK